MSSLLDDHSGATDPAPGSGSEPATGVAEGALAGLPGRPSTLGGAVYLLVLAVSAVGLVIVAQGSWRGGVRWIAAGLELAAVARLVIPRHQAGMLAVRRRPVDVAILALAGAALWFLSTSIPNQPPL